MAIRRRRRSIMSASAPAGRASNMSGKLSAASTSATIDGEDESEVISQPAPTSCIQVPTFETMVAIQRLRKSPFRKGLQAEGGAPVGVDAADAIFPACFTGKRLAQLHHELIDVAPAPVLSAFERGHDRMLRRAEM